MLPREPIVERQKSRLAPLVEVIAAVAGDGYSRPRRDKITVRTSDWAKAIADRAEAELAMRPVAERRAELLGRRAAGLFSEREDINQQCTLFQQIQERAPAIPTKPSFTRMDAAAHQAGDDLQQRLWRSGQRNAVASRRFQLPLSPNIDLGHLADALRDGLSFLMPTSEIEIPSPEQLVASMEHGAKIHPHLYPVNKK